MFFSDLLLPLLPMLAKGIPVHVIVQAKKKKKPAFSLEPLSHSL